MKKAIILAMFLAASLANAQMFAQMFSATGTPISAMVWYKLDGDALDSSGNGYNGTWVGTEAYAAGKFTGTQSGAFTNSMITVATNATLHATQMTFSFWVNTPGSGSTYMHIIGKNMWLNNTAYQIYLSPPVLNYFSTITNQFNTGRAVESNEWVHIAMRFDGTNCISYFNGASIATNKAVIHTAPDTPLYIGAWSETRKNPYKGKIDDVRIFNRALSQKNIQRIMQGQDSQPIEELQ